MTGFYAEGSANYLSPNLTINQLKSQCLIPSKKSDGELNFGQLPLRQQEESRREKKVCVGLTSGVNNIYHVSHSFWICFSHF